MAESVIRSLIKPIRAYHGSAYDFDRFDPSRIGTGEGAAAYGHGLYFAENEDVADTYRRSVSMLHATPEQWANEMWRRHTESAGGDTSKGLGHAFEHANESWQEAVGIPDAMDRWEAIIDHLSRIDSNNSRPPKRIGATYEVELPFSQDELLNFDNPLSNNVGTVAASVLRDHDPAAISQKTLREIESGDWRFI